MNIYEKCLCTLLVLFGFPSLSSAAVHQCDIDYGAFDIFHPPLAGEPLSANYKEWHYFTVLSEKHGISMGIALVFEGDVSDPLSSYALDLQNYSSPSQSHLTLEPYPIDMANWSVNSADIYVANSSVTVEENVYHVHSESPDGQTVLNATFIPKILPEAPMQLPMGGGVMYWFLASANMRVDGTLTVNKGTDQEHSYKLINEKGYHDHNWGFFNWGDDTGWDWGQAIYQKKSSRRMSEAAAEEAPAKTFALSILNMTDKEDLISRLTTVKFWINNKKAATFRDDEVSISHKLVTLPEFPNNPIPKVNFIRAVSGNNHLKIKFTTEQQAPMYLPTDTGLRFLWELGGNFEVEGVIDSTEVNFSTGGFMEYFAKDYIE